MRPIAQLATGALAILAGAGAGIHLGQSAIRQINPAYFGDTRETRFHADLVAYQSPDWASEAPVLKATPHNLRGNSCVKCTEPLWLADPIVEKIDLAARTDAPRIEVMDFAVEADSEIAAIERYAYFPIEADEGASSQD